MRAEPAPGVTLGYLAASAIVAALWFGIGLILLPVMLLLALLHGMAGAGRRANTAGTHHRWLAAHHLWSVAAYLFVLLAPLVAIPALLTDGMTVLNTLVQAPHPLTTLAAAWPTLDHWPLLIGSGLVFLSGWFVATLWISFRLLRRGLRWAEGAPAR